MKLNYFIFFNIFCLSNYIKLAAVFFLMGNGEHKANDFQDETKMSTKMLLSPTKFFPEVEIQRKIDTIRTKNFFFMIKVEEDYHKEMFMLLYTVLNYYRNSNIVSFYIYPFNPNHIVIESSKDVLELPQIVSNKIIKYSHKYVIMELQASLMFPHKNEGALYCKINCPLYPDYIAEVLDVDLVKRKVLLKTHYDINEIVNTLYKDKRQQFISEQFLSKSQIPYKKHFVRLNYRGTKYTECLNVYDNFIVGKFAILELPDYQVETFKLNFNEEDFKKIRNPIRNIIQHNPKFVLTLVDNDSDNCLAFDSLDQLNNMPESRIISYNSLSLDYNPLIRRIKSNKLKNLNNSKETARNSIGRSGSGYSQKGRKNEGADNKTQLEEYFRKKEEKCMYIKQYYLRDCMKKINVDNTDNESKTSLRDINTDRVEIKPSKIQQTILNKNEEFDASTNESSEKCELSSKSGSSSLKNRCSHKVRRLSSSESYDNSSYNSSSDNESYDGDMFSKTTGHTKEDLHTDSSNQESSPSMENPFDTSTEVNVTISDSKTNFSNLDHSQKCFIQNDSSFFKINSLENDNGATSLREQIESRNNRNKNKYVSLRRVIPSDRHTRISNRIASLPNDENTPKRISSTHSPPNFKLHANDSPSSVSVSEGHSHIRPQHFLHYKASPSIHGPTLIGKVPQRNMNKSLSPLKNTGDNISDLIPVGKVVGRSSLLPPTTTKLSNTTNESNIEKFFDDSSETVFMPMYAPYKNTIRKDEIRKDDSSNDFIESNENKNFASLDKVTVHELDYRDDSADHSVTRKLIAGRIRNVSPWFRHSQVFGSTTSNSTDIEKLRQIFREENKAFYEECIKNNLMSEEKIRKLVMDEIQPAVIKRVESHLEESIPSLIREEIKKSYDREIKTNVQNDVEKMMNDNGILTEVNFNRYFDKTIKLDLIKMNEDQIMKFESSLKQISSTLDSRIYQLFEETMKLKESSIIESAIQGALVAAEEVMKTMIHEQVRKEIDVAVESSIKKYIPIIIQETKEENMLQIKDVEKTVEELIKVNQNFQRMILMRSQHEKSLKIYDTVKIINSDICGIITKFLENENVEVLSTDAFLYNISKSQLELSMFTSQTFDSNNNILSQGDKFTFKDDNNTNNRYQVIQLIDDFIFYLYYDENLSMNSASVCHSSEVCLSN